MLGDKDSVTLGPPEANTEGVGRGRGLLGVMPVKMWREQG